MMTKLQQSDIRTLNDAEIESVGGGYVQLVYVAVAFLLGVGVALRDEGSSQNGAGGGSATGVKKGTT